MAAQRHRPGGPQGDPHIPVDEITTIAMDDPHMKALDEDRGRIPPPEEMLDFLEGNPGGRPCRDPLCRPDPEV